MRHSAPSNRCRRLRQLLLALGVIAVALHLLAGSGLPRLAPASPALVAELCTSHGVVKLDLASGSGNGSVPAGANHDCCKLCAGGGPLLANAAHDAVPPAPSFSAMPESRPATAPASPARFAHVPRGPPATA